MRPTEREHAAPTDGLAASVTDFAGATDEALLRRVRGGEPAAFEPLVRRYNRLLYRTIRSIVPNETEVEDLMQQTYLAAFANLDQFAGRSSLGTWLVRIAINQSLAFARKEQQHNQLQACGAIEPPSTDSALRCASARQAIAMLEEVILELPLIYRTVYVLREVEQLSTAETALALGITQATAKIRLIRAKLRVGQGLKHHDGKNPAEVLLFEVPRCHRVTQSVVARLSSA